VRCCPFRGLGLQGGDGFLLGGATCSVLLVALVGLTTVALTGCGRGRAAKVSCVAWLKQIEIAKYNWAEENGKYADDIPTDSDLFGPDRYMGRKPSCPQGGTYILGKVGEYPRCSIPMHSLQLGFVVVVDEAKAPIGGVRLAIRTKAREIFSVSTDAHGQAYLTGSSGFQASVVDDWSDGTKEIVASKAGYRAEVVPLPTAWPVRFALKRTNK
jgi:hypothetical protein